jgi:hypothetical protein
VDITLESFVVQTSNTAKVKIYVSSATILTSAKLKISNPDGSSAEAIIVINKASEASVKMTQINNNGSTWSPEKGPITIYFDGLPSTGRGNLVIASGFNGTRIPVDFATITANNGKYNLTKDNFNNGAPNGIYNVFLYNSSGKKLGKVKIVVFR